MKKIELRRRNEDLTARTALERAIIESLPEDLECITRVMVSRNHMESRANACGVIDLNVGTYAEALKLANEVPELWPVTTMRVTMTRAQASYMPTVSFYPFARIPTRWLTEHDVHGIYPVIWQMQPDVGRRDVKVFLEWFIEPGKYKDSGLKLGQCVNVRAFIQEHGARYVKGEGSDFFQTSKYRVEGQPEGRERVVQALADGPPYVTVYWDEYGETPELALLGRTNEEVAQVENQ